MGKNHFFESLKVCFEKFFKLKDIQWANYKNTTKLYIKYRLPSVVIAYIGMYYIHVSDKVTFL
jgi:hypothetical protein